MDRVRLARSLAPNREVQRLAIDLDGARVALRVHGDDVAVKVVSDPTGTLTARWASDVERTLDRVARAAGEPPAGAQSQARPDDSGRGRQRQSERSTRQQWSGPSFAAHLDGELV